MFNTGGPRSALGFQFAWSESKGCLRGILDDLFGELERVAGTAAQELDVSDLTLLADQLASMLSQINLSAIDAAAGNLLLHAGAVCRPDGRCAVLCGPSGSGKSTLVLRLTELGSHYLTDEVVCLDPHTLRLTPYRKPIVLKTGSQHLFSHLRPEPSRQHGSWLLPPSIFDHSRRPAGPFEPSVLIFPRYAAGTDLRIDPLPEGESAYLLGGQSSRLQDVAGGPLSALARLARRAPAYRVIFGDVDVAAGAVTDLLSVA